MTDVVLEGPQNEAAAAVTLFADKHNDSHKKALREELASVEAAPSTAQQLSLRLAVFAVKYICSRSFKI